MIIKAIFTGTKSLDYENGKEYQLKLSDVKGVSVTRLDGSGKCSYESLSSFLKNWNNITVQLENNIASKDSKFTCYEIWRPNIPAYGCETQCKECLEKQKQS